MDQLWAHSANRVGDRHPIAAHLPDTGAGAHEYGSAFDSADLAGRLAVLHDIGKAAGSWQQKLLQAEPTGEPVGIDHARAGTWFAHRVLGLGPFAGVVAGHHRGLLSIEQLQAEIALAEGEYRADVQEAIARVSLVLPEHMLTTAVRLPGWLSEPETERCAGELLVRMVFSAVVDADRLDTERHFHPERRRKATPSAATLVESFERRRRRYLARPQGYRSPLAGIRDLAYRQAVAAAKRRPGLFRLPGPTGLGKTIIAAGFALHHACYYGMRRVVVAVPYMSITEQNSRAYRNLLGNENVLEHHSGVDVDDLPATLRWQKLAAENWDAPFIVTTTVQLFESLFSNKPGTMRKLHRLARSVIILDEVQALPDDLLLPILSVLRHLTQHFGCTVLLSSATQPEFWSLPPFKDLEAPSVIPEPSSFYRAVQEARKVRFEWWTHPKPTLEQIAKRAAAEPQVLVIMNTTADAARMHELLDEMRQADGPVLHLSKRMASAHIRETLNDIVSLLKGRQPVAVVATQLVEAGVDLDFPMVMRQLSPIDSIIQAAGRCNRECELAGGLVIVFDLADGSPAASRIYGAAQAASSKYFGDRKASPDDLNSLAEYYLERYSLKNIVHASRGARIQELRADFNFPQVANEFRMIDDTSVPVVVPYMGEATGPTRRRLLGLLRSQDAPPAWVHRRLRPLLASLPASQAQQAVKAGLAVSVVGDLIEWRASYHHLRGIELPQPSTGEGRA